MIIEGDVHIGRTPDEVFGFLTDPDHWAEVDQAMIAMTVSGPVGLGTSGTLTYRRSGVKVTNTYEITVFEPPDRLEVTLRGMGYELREMVRLEAVGGGTRVAVTDTVEPTSLVGRVLVAMSGRVVRRDLESRRANLKAALEREG